MQDLAFLAVGAAPGFPGTCRPIEHCIGPGAPPLTLIFHGKPIGTTYREHGQGSAVPPASNRIVSINSVGATAVTPRLAGHRHGGDRAGMSRMGRARGTPNTNGVVTVSAVRMSASRLPGSARGSLGLAVLVAAEGAFPGSGECRSVRPAGSWVPGSGVVRWGRSRSGRWSFPMFSPRSTPRNAVTMLSKPDRRRSERPG
jgi:hypothetical protein